MGVGGQKGLSRVLVKEEEASEVGVAEDRALELLVKGVVVLEHDPSCSIPLEEDILVLGLHYGGQAAC